VTIENRAYAARKEAQKVVEHREESRDRRGKGGHGPDDWAAIYGLATAAQRTEEGTTLADADPSLPVGDSALLPRTRANWPIQREFKSPLIPGGTQYPAVAALGAFQPQTAFVYQARKVWIRMR
jgi:hypothetical protein